MITEAEVRTRYETAHALILVNGALRLIAINTDTHEQENLKSSLAQLAAHIDAMIERLTVDAGCAREKGSL